MEAEKILQGKLIKEMRRRPEKYQNALQIN